MRINSIANSPYFGYDEKLNARVNYKLRNTKGNKDFADELRTLNTCCMDIEDKLRAAEADGNPTLVDMYASLLLGIKNVVTNQINGRFPKLCYRDTELKKYSVEAAKKKNLDPTYWLNQMVLILDNSAEIDAILSNAEKDDIPNEIGQKQDKVQFNSTKSHHKDSYKRSAVEQKQACELVEAFIPGKYSPNGFKSIGGMDNLKEKIFDKIINPLKNPEQAKLDEIEYGKNLPRGELLYGPPGCGKTYFAEAVSLEADIPMFKFKNSKVGSMFVDGKSINLQIAYDYLKDIAAKTGKPVIMFIDEMESLTPIRDGKSDKPEASKAVDTMLQIMDEARNDKIFIIGATNQINSVDPAILSRFDNKDYIGIPDDNTRRIMLTMNLNKFAKGQSLANNSGELEKVVNMTKGFSNRTITVLVGEASDIARKDGRRNITASDFTRPVAEHKDDIIRNENIYMAKSKAPSIGYT